MAFGPAPVFRSPSRRIENLPPPVTPPVRYSLKSQNPGVALVGLVAGLQLAADPAGRNCERAAHAVGLTCALVVAEEEQLIFNDGAADRAAELRPARGRNEAMSDGIAGWTA